MTINWKELSKIALLGTEHSHLSDATKEKLKYHGIHLDRDEPQILLESAAFFSQMQKAAFLIEIFKHELQKPAEDIEERIISLKSTNHLSLILNGDYEDALPEFIKHLVENNRQLSPKALPDLLNKSVQSKIFWEKIKPVIGIRGWWLLEQNPVWQFLETIPSPEKWSRGTKEERLSFITLFRERDAPKGLHVLEATWEKESLQDKVDFLSLLNIGLSLSDEPFLENCLYESRKKIRDIAAQLLARIEDSKLSNRMFLRATDSILLNDKELTILLPNELDETAIRDGINPKFKKQLGQKTSILYQILMKVSPSKWEAYFKLPPEKILKLYYQSEWSEILIQATIKATVLYENPNWAKPLLEMWLHLGNSDLWHKMPVLELAEIISTETFLNITIQHLEKNNSFLKEKSPILNLLINTSHQWNEHLGMLAIGRFQQWIIATSTHSWGDYSHYKSLLKNAAYKCSPSLFERLKSGWGRNSLIWGMWEPEVEQFLRVLIFRKEMINTLKGETSNLI